MQTAYRRRLDKNPDEAITLPVAGQLLGAGTETLRNNVEAGRLQPTDTRSWGEKSLVWVTLGELERWRVDCIRRIRAGKESWTHSTTAMGLLTKLIEAGGDPDADE